MENEDKYQDMLKTIAPGIETIVEKKRSFLDICKTALLLALRSIPDGEHLIQNIGERLVDHSLER